MCRPPVTCGLRRPAAAARNIHALHVRALHCKMMIMMLQIFLRAYVSVEAAQTRTRSPMGLSLPQVRPNNIEQYLG
jgi:hypothetical protein